MKTIIVILFAIIVVVLAVVAVRAQSRRKQSPAEVSRGLRNQALTLSPKDLGLSVAAHQPFAVIMDTAYPNAVASLMSTSTGDASNYFSTGGGVIGGIGHENVRKAAIEFVAEAAKHSARMAPTSEFPYPAPGNVRFYLRTPETVLVAEAPEAELGSRSHPLSPFFFAGQNVIAQLRQSTESQKQCYPRFRWMRRAAVLWLGPEDSTPARRSLLAAR